LTTTTKSRAAAANDSDRKWPLVWKGSFVCFEILLLTTIDDFSCNNKKRNKQTASTLFNVVGLGTQLGLFPPKKWHHFLGGKSCSQAPRPTTLKRVDAVCLLHSLLLQEKSSMPRADEPERDYYFARHCG